MAAVVVEDSDEVEAEYICLEGTQHTNLETRKHLGKWIWLDLDTKTAIVMIVMKETTSSNCPRQSVIP